MLSDFFHALPSATNATEPLAWAWAIRHPYLYTVISVMHPYMFVIVAVVGVNLINRVFRDDRRRGA